MRSAMTNARSRLSPVTKTSSPMRGLVSKNVDGGLCSNSTPRNRLMTSSGPVAMWGLPRLSKLALHSTCTTRSEPLRSTAGNATLLTSLEPPRFRHMRFCLQRETSAGSDAQPESCHSNTLCQFLGARQPVGVNFSIRVNLAAKPGHALVIDQGQPVACRNDLMIPNPVTQYDGHDPFLRRRMLLQPDGEICVRHFERLPTAARRQGIGDDRVDPGPPEALHERCLLQAQV